MSNGTNPKSPKFLTKLGMLIGFIVEVVTQIFFNMSEAELQYQLNRKDGIRKDLRKMFKATDVFVEEKELWRKFYQKHFALDVNFADVMISEKPTEGKWRLIIIAAGLTMNQVYGRMSALFTCSQYSDDLDASVTKNARDTKKAYAIWVRDEVEPDTEFLGKSTNQADPDMSIGVTLLERMIHEVDYFSETGKHLDIKGVTFCSGSRCSDGGVPFMDWNSDYQRVYVSWNFLSFSGSNRGIRRAVTL